jgi:mono/diheme cytochrome c family protein
MMTSIRLPLALSVVSCCVLFAIARVRSAENHPEVQHSAASDNTPAITDQQKSEAKAIFAAQCGWCHGDYGMKADKGPRLAGTQMTEQQVEQRIHDGKPGYMPSFSKFLDDDQIKLMAKYIKSLKPEG